MEEKEVNKKILKSIYENRIKILILGVSLAVITAIITFFIPKKYTAYGVIYPSQSNSIKEAINHPDFGFEVHADRLVQLFQSQTMINHIVQKFNLIQYYEIDTNQAGWEQTLQEEFYESIQVDRTKYLSVSISSTFKDPKLSALITNDMMDYVDTLKTNLFNNDIILLRDISLSKIKNQTKTVDSLLEQLNNSKNGSLNITLSAHQIGKINERSKNGHHLLGDNIIFEALSSNYSLETENLINDYYHELNILNKIKQDLALANEKLSEPIASSYKISRAVPNVKKSSPSIVKNSIISLIIGLILGVFMIAFKEKWRQFTYIVK